MERGQTHPAFTRRLVSNEQNIHELTDIPLVERTAKGAPHNYRYLW